VQESPGRPRSTVPEKPTEGLTDRSRSVLRDVVEAYIVHAEPVSSAKVSRRRELSSATIRNVMAELDSLGYLTQPHTSAGRIPTDKGYRFFVDSLMKERALDRQEQSYIEEELERAGDAERSTLVATRLLSGLSKQAGVILVPARGDVVLRSFDVVPLEGKRVVCVVTSSGGFIDHRVIELDAVPARDELIRISNYVTRHFRGQTLFEARTNLLRRMADEKAQVDLLMQRSLELVSRGLESSGGPGLHVDGTESLLGLPEMADVGRVRQLFEAFTDKAQLVAMLTRCLEGEGVRVLIGDDADLTSRLDFSLVATTYNIDGRPMGSLGVLGPSRMEYQRLIPLVNFLGQALSSALGGGRELE